jgi:DNA-binding transcriptional LysR family regulator
MKQINQLEKHFGFRLFRRGPQGVTLTKAGASLYEDALALQRQSEAALLRARSLQAGEQTEIRVGTSLLYPCRAFMEIWQKMEERFPMWRFSVVPFEDTETEGTHRALGKKYDLIVGVFDASTTLSYCAFLELGRRRFCVAMSRRHRLAGKERIFPEDLAGERLMLMKQGNSPINDRFRKWLSEDYPDIILEDTPYHFDVKLFNRCEEGRLLLTPDGWQDIHPSLATIPFDSDLTIPYGVMYARETSADVQRFIDVIKETRASWEKESI